MKNLATAALTFAMVAAVDPLAAERKKMKAVYFEFIKNNDILKSKVIAKAARSEIKTQAKIVYDLRKEYHKNKRIFET